MTDIYICTVLLEKNRWAKGKQPTYLVSEWISRFQEAGFAGIELWENHALLASEEERRQLKESGFPIAIFNTYAGFGAAEMAAAQKAAEMVHEFGSAGVKFNLGREQERRTEYIDNVLAWAQTLPADTRLLCECHAGTIMENPPDAQAIFAAWEDPRCQAIVHPFERDLKKLQTWFELLGERITHAHVQLRDENGAIQRLFRNPKLVKEALHIMREEGFRGTFSIEFTEGTGKPDENKEDLFRAALDDLDFMRQTWE
ncbi:MAG TPA: sugar phosphate isomerase/epimerase [Firmicutes bacterium]|nr:sugar phosphate isomerase/epimerase [Bacillota bacterium]